MEIRNNVLFPIFIQLLQKFNEYKVEYVLVGGYAVVLRGYGRMTGDIDLWVKPTEENYWKIKRASDDCYLPISEMTKDSFLEVNKLDVWSFGVTPQTIEYLTKVKGLDFDESKQEQEVFLVDGVELPVISYNHLIRAKKAAGRYKDLDDIENLEAERD